MSYDIFECFGWDAVNHVIDNCSTQFKRLINNSNALLNLSTCPPTSHTVKLIFLYSTVSTLNPGVLKDDATKFN